MRTLVILPTYNEAQNIVAVLGQLRKTVPAADILVVDDASPDGTAAMARAVGAALGRIEVLVRAGKLGLGSAYREGFRVGLARGYQVLVEMDADLSHQASALPGLLKAVARDADLAVGSRYIAGGSVPNWPLHRRALSRWGNRYARWALSLPLVDATSGFRAYRASLVARIDLASVRSDGYAFQIEMAHKAASVGGKIVEVPIEFRDRERGVSKMSFPIVLEALLLVTWWSMWPRPEVRTPVRRLPVTEPPKAA